jgi:hypothetical protein
LVCALSTLYLNGRQGDVLLHWNSTHASSLGAGGRAGFILTSIGLILKCGRAGTSNRTRDQIMLGCFCNSLLFLCCSSTFRSGFSGTACGKTDCIHCLLDLQLDEHTRIFQHSSQQLSLCLCEWNKHNLSSHFLSRVAVYWDLERCCL